MGHLELYRISRRKRPVRDGGGLDAGRGEGLELLGGGAILEQLEGVQECGSPWG